MLRAIGEFLGKNRAPRRPGALKKIFESRGGFPTRYETLYFLSEMNDARVLGLPVEELWEGHGRSSLSDAQVKRPDEFEGINEDHAKRIELSHKTLDQWKELPSEIRARIPRTLDQYIMNPQAKGLGAEKVRTDFGIVTRIRINDYYRIHLISEGDHVKVVAIGPHRLMGIG